MYYVWILEYYHYTYWPFTIFILVTLWKTDKDSSMQREGTINEQDLYLKTEDPSAKSTLTVRKLFELTISCFHHCSCQVFKAFNVTHSWQNLITFNAHLSPWLTELPADITNIQLSETAKKNKIWNSLHFLSKCFHFLQHSNTIWTFYASCLGNERWNLPTS